MLKNPKYVYGDGVVNVPSHLNFGQFMINTLSSYKSKVALINGLTDERTTFYQIVKDAIHLAISLISLGVRRGDTVAICSENRTEYWSAVIGIACTGATVTAVSPIYTKDELKHVLQISRPTVVFYSPTSYKLHEKALQNLTSIRQIILFGADSVPNTILYKDVIKTSKNPINYEDVTNFVAVDVNGQADTLFILYSSGTTGLPKGVSLTHLNVLNTCGLPNALNPDKLCLMITPWYHTMGLMRTLINLAAGSTTVHLPKFETDLYLKTIEKYKIVQLVVAPPVLVSVSKYQSSYDLSSVKMVYSGAAPLREDTIQSVKKRFPNLTNVLQGYGMTEATLAVTRDCYDTAHLAKTGSSGPVVPTSIVKVVDIQTGLPLGPYQEGELYVKGPSVMKGYIGKDKTEDFDEEGFYKTGDIGYYDEDKRFFIVDRLKELIKYKGYQVPPAEIEGVLLQHPDIRDAGVIGVPHDAAGEVPQAFVVLQPQKTVTELEIQEFVASKLSNPKHLRGGVKFVNDIPKNPSGKILRKILREWSNIKHKL